MIMRAWFVMKWGGKRIVFDRKKKGEEEMGEEMVESCDML